MRKRTIWALAVVALIAIIVWACCGCAAHDFELKVKRWFLNPRGTSDMYQSPSVVETNA